MKLLETKVKADVKTTFGGEDVSVVLQQIATEAHEGIMFTDDMDLSDKFDHVEIALYRILDILGD